MSKALFASFKEGIQDCIPETVLEDIASKKNLIIKWGADPSAPDLHFGHMVILTKLRQLQDLGHKILFIIGDFTAIIGDPTGKSETRKPLSAEEVQQNSKTYQDQVFKVLDKKKTIIRYNSEWLSKLTSIEMVKLTAHYTVARMLERDDFKKRFKQNQSIGVHEFLYPLLQGYDSVAIKADIEIGGTDQTFNLLVGRHLQKEYGQKPQQIITLPILEGLDGVQKMSKSLKNHIGITESPKEIFGKCMSIPDSLLVRYYTLLTSLDPNAINTIETDLSSGSVNPKHIKEDLAKLLVTQVHSAEEAEGAQQEFNRVFAKKDVPDDMPTIAIKNDEPVRIDMILSNEGLSKKESHRLIKQGAVSLDGDRIDDPFYSFTPQQDSVLKVGKRRFFQFKR